MYTKQIDKLKYEIIFESEDELKDFKNFINPPKTLKASEVMKILGISRVTLCHYVKQGKVKVFQHFPNAKYVYDYGSVMSLRGN